MEVEFTGLDIGVAVTGATPTSRCGSRKVGVVVESEQYSSTAVQ